MRGHMGETTQLFPVWKELYLVREPENEHTHTHTGEKKLSGWKEFYPVREPNCGKTSSQRT